LAVIKLSDIFKSENCSFLRENNIKLFTDNSIILLGSDTIYNLEGDEIINSLGELGSNRIETDKSNETIHREKIVIADKVWEIEIESVYKVELMQKIVTYLVFNSVFVSLIIILIIVNYSSQKKMNYQLLNESELRINLEQEVIQKRTAEAKLKDQNLALGRAELELKTRNTELEEMNKSMIGRELKMIELKKELEQLQKSKVII
jgi:hypothetical protein